jgi:outer membrane protein assembly factor BamB
MSTLHERILRLLACSAVVVACCASQVHAQLNERLLNAAGLEIQWENNLGGAGLAQGEQSLTLWPHATERREFVDVYVGGRLIERIDARQADRAAIDRLILEGKPLKPTPVLGMEGARARAAELEKTYSILGKQVSTKEFSEPVIYLVAATRNGIISAIDAESGEVLWQSTVPNSYLSIYGPGVSDEHVTVVNGNALYAMELKTGNLLTTSRLLYTPTSSPMPMGDYIMVPSVDGRLMGYHLEKPLIKPIYLRSGIENRNSTAMSINRAFLAWCSQGSLFLVHNEKEPIIWSKVNAGEDADSRPIPTQQGFVFCSHFGTVIHASTNRLGTYLWRSNLGMPTMRSPVVGNNRVFLLSDDGLLACLDLETGNAIWPTRAQNVNQVLGVGKEAVYVRDTTGTLVSLRLSDGQPLARTGTLIQGSIPNSINDRLFVVTRDGHITCLRETGAVKPTMYVDPSDKTAPSGDGRPGQPNKETPKPSNNDDPFSPSGLDAAPAARDAKDPFDPF